MSNYNYEYKKFAFSFYTNNLVCIVDKESQLPEIILGVVAVCYCCRALKTYQANVLGFAHS